jgi:hypothetical protein
MFADPHPDPALHFDADPDPTSHSEADQDSDTSIQPFNLMQIRIVPLPFFKIWTLQLSKLTI